MFSILDNYTSSGSNLLYNCWTQNVTKFDTSSFYNWEEDNLPLLDLQERTHLLWERLGFHGSSMTGFGLVVSSNATDSCNSRVFTSLSACMNALPEVIDAPYYIEVASFGELGELNLINKKGGPRGSIEIINRNFGCVEATTSATQLALIKPRVGDAYGIASSVISPGVPGQFHNTYRDIPSIIHDFQSASCITISSTVFSSTSLTGPADPRLQNNLTLFARMANPVQTTRMTAALAFNNTTSSWTSSPTSGTISFLPYEYGANVSNDLISTYDASTINELTNTEEIWNSSVDDGLTAEANAVAYGNRLSKLRIQNCNFPIIIRNFTVDGGGSFSGVEYGIEISNSTNVILERCSASRCRKAGLYLNNSKVGLTRGFVAYRNYDYRADNGNRAGLPWISKINGAENTNVSSMEQGAGILAINSELNFSSTLIRDVNLYRSIWNLWHADVRNQIPGPPIVAYGWLYCLSKNSIGLHAINSKITGGQREANGTSTLGFYNVMNFISELNTNAGIKLDNSYFELDGRLACLGNFVGIDSNNSDIKTDIAVIRFNQKEGINLNNSILSYNKNLYTPHDGRELVVENSTYKLHQNAFQLNGTHLNINGSKFIPTECSSIPTKFERLVFSGNFGKSGNTQLPAITVANNSFARFIHPSIENSNSYTQEGLPSFGAGLLVDNNSEVMLQGTSSYATKVFGPNTVEKQQYKAGLCATSNSKIRISGPTVIARYAVDILGQNNSVIEISPHKKIDGTLDISGMNLNDPANHTMVELHSTRACIVVDKGSVLDIKDLGDYRSLWGNGSYGTTQLLSSLDYVTDGSYLNTQMFTSGGSIQFYPNPNDVTHYPPAIEAPSISLYSNNSFQTNPQGKYYFFNDGIGDPSDQNNFSSITFGGVCVRALNESKVNLLNVHFPTGWWNPSGIIYDVSGADSVALCNRLFIFNIADNSIINAKYLSVSSMHPADAAYHGPSGTWGVSAAPIGTPDTSSLSVLDYYGKGSGHPLMKSDFENNGPFRLYFSIQPEANWLIASSFGMSGFIPQVFSQGYQFSGVTVLPGNLSSFYTSFLKQDGANLTISAFHYGSAVVTSPFTVKAILDDSAANTFANAKHCSVGKSGLCKVTSIYFPYTNTYGGESANSSAKQFGRGFKSSNVFDLERNN